LKPCLPDADIWVKAFSRQAPEPLLVLHLGQAIRERRVFLLGPVRQVILDRCRDERQIARVASLIAAFPHLPITAVDHVEAAGVAQRLRQQGIEAPARRRLLWAVASRIGGEVWSTAAGWSALADLGCPLRR